MYEAASFNVELHINEQCQNMLKAMVRCGSQFFALFLQSLNDVGHGYMAQHLKDSCVALEQGWEKLPEL